MSSDNASNEERIVVESREEAYYLPCNQSFMGELYEKEVHICKENIEVVK